jgi:hypothetical protein
MSNTNTSDRDSGRRKLGRRSRKMRRKILATEASRANGSTLDTVDSDNNFRSDCKQSISSYSAPEISKQVPAVPTGPTDRSYVQESCKKLSRLTESDRVALTRQLGYLPGNALEVVARVKDAFVKDPSCASKNQSVMEEKDSLMMNDPLVIKLYPLVVRDETEGSKSKRKRKRSPDDDVKHPHHSKSLLLEPFPTIFWLTHPRIKALVSKLELDGMGRHCEKLVTNSMGKVKKNILNSCHSERGNHGGTTTYEWQNSDESPIASMTRAHLAYGKERQELLSKEDWAYIQQRKWDQAFSSSRGVAGINNYASVKCLHAHVAHFWSGCHDNLIGQWVAERLVPALKELIPPSSA